jgi:hypothetical protein
LVLLLGGLLAGIGLTLVVQLVGGAHGPISSHYQATIYLPTQDNAGQPFSEERWREAIQLLVTRHGGATVGGELEGWWVEEATGKTYREPVRPVVVTLPRGQVGALEQTAREVGAKLSQEAVYFRLEDADVRVISVAEKSRKRE